MNQAVLFNFAVTREDKDKNVRVYQLTIQPGAPWEELYDALAEFEREIKALEVKAKAEEEAKKAEPIEPEVVNPVSE